MNKLYLLGVLALANVEAYIDVGATTKTNGLAYYGKVTYTSTGDCFTTGTATSLGMNNIYYQYYSFTLAKGTTTIATVVQVGTTPTYYYPDGAFNACTHSHLYNWMAQPAIGASTIKDGISDAVVAYGYVMSGTTLTACALTNSVVTTSLYSSTTKIFSGAKYGTVTAIITPSTDITTASGGKTTPLMTTTGSQGLNSLVTAATTVSAFVASTSTISPSLSTIEVVTTSAQNFYYDFMQTQVFQGQTQFGRGGGASTAPCGWWVVYTYETGIYKAGGATSSTDFDPATAWNTAATWNSATIHMWTDNALVNTMGAFLLAGLGAVLY